MADYEDQEYGGGSTSSCPNCGRTFNSDVLARHAPICKKTALKAKKRKVFDSGKQRAAGSDIPVKSTLRPGQAPKTQPASKKNNWRQKHQDFISAIRNARGVTQALKTGAPLPPPPAPSINPDYVQCKYCGRRFNEKSHGRHEPFCKEQASRISSKPVISDAAKQRVAARSQFGANRAKKFVPDMMDQSNGGESYGYSNTSYGTPSARGRPPGGTRGGSSKSSSSRGARLGTGLWAGRRDSGSSIGGAYGNMSKSQSTGQVNDPGMGKPMRTGRDPQTYQDAKNSVRGSSYGRGTMSRYSNSMESLTPLSPAGSPSDFDSRISPSRGTPPSSGRTMNNNVGGGTRQGSAGGKFCHECGNKFPVATAKFCCNCGLKRLSTGGF